MQLLDPAFFVQQTSLAAKPIAHLFMEHLTNLDFSLLDNSGQLTGESWAVDIIISGDLNQEGMLIDFGQIKKAIKADIESLWDHKLLIPWRRPGLKYNDENPASAVLTWQSDQQQHYTHTSPSLAVYSLPVASLDQSALAQHLRQWLLNKWKSEQIQDLQLSFRTESTQQNTEAFFKYSHGLRMHKGACQRIAHGHRSKVRVFTTAGFDLAASHALAKAIDNRYFVDRATILSHTQQTLTLGYSAPEGYYQLELPAAQVVIMDNETTIENIAVHLLSTLPQGFITVQVFEGWQKGAFAVRSS